MIRTRYGGVPLPVMLIDKFEHCWGEALKTQEYAAENVGRVMSWRRTSGAKRSRDSIAGKDREMRSKRNRDEGLDGGAHVRLLLNHLLFGLVSVT